MHKGNFKKGFLLLVLVIATMIGMAVTAHAEEYSGTAKGTGWAVNTDTGVLTINVEGPMGSWTEGAQPWYKYRSYITSLEFSAATSKITNYAFSDLVNLQSIDIPNSVEEIGDYAFVNCQSATELYIPISVATWGGYVFQGCSSIDYIYTENQANINKTAPIWDDSVGTAAADAQVELQIESKSIGQYAFYGLSSVTKVDMPTTLTGINDYAFYGFTSPFALNLGSATNIGQYAFYGCTGVTSIDLPVATTIGDYAFYGCNHATSVNLPVATSIGANAFQNCTGATTINVGATTCTYGAECFAGCSGMTNMYLGSIGFTTGSNALNGAGASGGFTLTLGKAITSIGSTLQKEYIGTSSKITMNLEDGSALASISASAFEGNTMLGSVDLSNRSGALSLGAKAFNNATSITYFRTNKGALTLTSLSMGNLVNLGTLDYSAATTTLGWTPANITVTRTLSGTTMTGSTSSNAASSVAGTGTTAAQTGNAYYWNGNQYVYISGITLTLPTVSKTLSNSFTETGTATLSYSFSGDNTGTHPFYKMGNNTESGTEINFTDTVVSIPDYLFTTGIQMVETSNGAQTISPASTTESNTDVSSTATTNTILDGANNPRKFGSYYRNSAGAWSTTEAAISGTTGTVSFTHTSTIARSLSYTVTQGTKANYSTGIKIHTANSTSKALANIGTNVIGTVNYDLATTTSKVTVPTITANSTTSSGTVSASVSAKATGYMATQAWAYSSYSGVTYPYYIFSSNQNAATTSGTTTSYMPITIGNTYYNENLGSWNANSGTFSYASTWYCYGYFGFPSAANATAAVQTMTGDPTATYTTSGTTTTAGTSTLAQSTKQESIACTVISTGSYSKASLYSDSATTLNLTQAAANASIAQYAFSGDNSITSVYLASTFSGVDTNAFYTRGTGTMYIYGHTSADPIAQQAGIKTNNSYTLSWQPNLKDYGIFIKSYTVGSGATAYLYLTTGNNYLLNITGTGATTDYTAETRPGWVTDGYAPNITELVIDNGITTIGDYMFYDHPKLQVLTVGNGITSIGSYAFAKCSSFEGLHNWPFPVDTIKDHAFAETATTTAEIPATVKTMGAGIYADDAITNISYKATSANDLADTIEPFSGINASNAFTITIADTVTRIPAFLFYQCNAKAATIGAAVADIGEGAFGGAEAMTLSVAAGNTIYKVGQDGNLYSADGSTMITYLGKITDEAYALPTTVTAIADGAFYGQTHLTQVSFDATITSIGKDAFASCSNLKTIAVSDFMDQESFNGEVTTGDNWSGSATVIFSGLSWDIGVTKGALTATLYSDGTLDIAGTGPMKSWASAAAVDWYAKRASITKVTFNGTCSSIGAYAFSGCTNLQTIKLPSTVTDIGQYAFYGCTNLADMKIPDAVTKINTYTFANCVNLTSTDLGTGMTTLEPFAFAGCTNARYISINGTVNEVKANVFQGDKNMTLLIMGKTSASDFSTHDGIVESDVFRICYMPDIKSGHLLGRYAGNEATGLYTGYAVETDLYAYSFDSDGDGKGDYLHIAGASAMQTTWASFDAVPWKSLQHTLTKVYIEDDVTSVGPYAFEGCDALKYVYIGQGAATISTHSFYGCSALEKLVCDVRLYNTGSLTTSSNVFVGAGSPNGFTVIFGNDATRIPGYMFYNCVNLTNVTIGKGVESINSYAFAGCTGLKTLYLQGTTISSTDANVFTNAGTLSGGFTVEVASNVTKIPDSLFYAEAGNPYVLSVTVDAGSKLQTIGSRAFSECNRLDSANFANCSLLQYIQNEAFSDCSRLVTVDLSNCTELYTISAKAFYNCINLSALSISNDNKLNEIGADTFNGTTQVANIVLPASVKIVSSNSFGNWVNSQIIFVLGKTDQAGFTSATSSWSGNATVVYTKLTWDMSVAGDGSIIAYYCVPDSQLVNKDYVVYVTGTGDMKDFDSSETINWPGTTPTSDIRDTVTKVVVNDGITRIGNNDFAGFTKCSSLSIGSNVKEIGESAFSGDSLIPEVDLSNARANLNLIDSNAFSGCSGVSTVNLSGCDALTAVGDNAFKDLAGSSVVYVSSDYLYDMLANVNGNIKSTYGTTDNTKVTSVNVLFSTDLSSQGVVAGTTVTWSVEATCNDNLTFTWYYATEQGGQWTEITSAMNGFTVNSTTKTSVLTMDSSIVTADKNGWYFYCAANSPYYNAESSKAALAVYSAAITPVVTVVDKNGDSLESNTWTQGPLTIYITPGSASNGITPTYQYKLKASGTWRNVEDQMTYNTEGIVTFYCRAIINDDNNTASTPVKYILKVDNTSPDVSIAADPEFESTDSVTLTATATDQTSGVNSVTWYKTAADANDSNMNSGVTGYVPLLSGVDMNTMTLSVRHFRNDSGYTADVYSTTYVGKNETHNATLNTTLNTADESDLLANYAAANAAVTSNTLDAFDLYEVHVMDADSSDYGISASNKGVVTIPVPTGYDTTRLAVYMFSKAGTMVPLSSFTLSSGKDSVTFAVPAFGQFMIGEKPLPTEP